MSFLQKVLAVADPGPVFTAELVPLSNRGKLRVTYNWLYSALNCDPSDASPFAWVVAKVDETHVSLSPHDPYGGMTLYASVRDDNAWFLQVQAPYSADWITAVRRDEILAADYGDLLTVSFRGFNGDLVTLDAQTTVWGGHSGYRLRSVGTAAGPDSEWFMGIQSFIQENLTLAIDDRPTDEEIKEVYASHGMNISANAFNGMRGLVRSAAIANQ